MSKLFYSLMLVVGLLVLLTPSLARSVDEDLFDLSLRENHHHAHAPHNHHHHHHYGAHAPKQGHHHHHHHAPSPKHG
ncbi:hypothetical protein ABFS83_04G203700 [Erythranthe nasuta]